MAPLVRYSPLIAALLFGVMACAKNPNPDDTAPATAASASKAVVQVTNQNFYDMDIYLVRYGQRRRLGTATGNSTRTFEISSDWIGNGPVRFLARPIGPSGREFSQELDIKPGDVVSLTIQP